MGKPKKFLKGGKNVRSSKCDRCGRALKNPVYIELGYGKVCAAKMGILVPSKKRAGDVEEPYVRQKIKLRRD